MMAIKKKNGHSWIAPFSRKGILTHQVSESGFVMSHQVVYDCSPAERERCGQLEVTLPYEWQQNHSDKKKGHVVQYSTHWLTQEESIWKNV